MTSEHPRRLLSQLNLRARKGYGQNFLTDSGLAHHLVDTCDLDPRIPVIEIGPGLGAMTGILAERGLSLTGIEADRNLAVHLQEQMKAYPNVTLIQGDILVASVDEKLPQGDDLQVVANLPYNQATEILFFLLRTPKRFQKIAIMVQKEVGERIQAQPGTKAYGRLSVLPQVFYRVEKSVSIGREQFFPQPKVDSVFLVLVRRQEPVLDLTPSEYRKFFNQFLEDLFKWRRKTIRNSLANGRFGQTVPWIKVLQDCQIDNSRRAETLTIQEMGVLARKAWNHF